MADFLGDWVPPRRAAPRHISPATDVDSTSRSLYSDFASDVSNGPEQPSFPEAAHADSDHSDSDQSESAASDQGGPDPFEWDLHDNDEEIRPTTVALGLSKDYVRNWGPADAFREFYQNWKDAIVTTFNLDPRSFKPQWKETRNEIQITMRREVPVAGRRPDEELLGYIRFKKKEGSLELSNFSAKLEMRNLALGGGTKSQQDNTAGVHGEGFKIASLVMLRSSYAVRISSTSHYWNFGLRGMYRDRLYCRITAAKPDVIRRNREIAAFEASSPRNSLTPRVWQDVTVKISKGRNGLKITEDSVRKWFKVSIDLVGPRPDSVIRADHGDLILDEAFASKIFLKGLRVDGQGPDGREYILGYNFATGAINRDRERLMNKRQEASMVASMWERAILDGPEDVIRRYIQLFRDHEDSPDIALAERVVSERVATRMWAQLRADEPDVFFYSEDSLSQSDQVTIILANIKKKPERAPAALWKVLRKYRLAKTPEEERRDLFKSCERVEAITDIFGANVLRMLKCAMLLDTRLEEIKFQVVKGGETGLDLIYKEEEKFILLHSKWLDFDETHKQVFCDFSELSQEVEMRGFSCDHVVEDLIELVIGEVDGALGIAPAEAKTIRQLARERIRQTPRRVSVSPTPKCGELQVRWVGNESGIVARDHPSKIFYDVILHRISSCREKREQLLYQCSRNGDGEISPACGCERQTICLRSCRAIFSGLDPREEYFPMVARSGAKTFFGWPPREMVPRLYEDDMTAQEEAESQIDSRGTSTPASSLDTPGFMAFPSDSMRGSRQESAELEYGYSHDNDDTGYIEARSNTAHCDAVVNSVHSPSHNGQGLQLQAHDKESWEELHQDVKDWQKWYTTDLPRIVPELFYMSPTKSQCNSPNIYMDSSILCERLGCKFERDSYVRFRLDSNMREHIALIHEIHSGADGCAMESPHFTATVYSFLEADPLFRDPSLPADAEPIHRGHGELLLHFSSLENMGSQSDSLLIDMDDIIEAKVLSPDFEVVHCAPSPRDENDDTPFCRFARTASTDAITLVPLAPHLLKRQDRWRPKGLSDPTMPFVIDLTPNVLGPLEGFTESGCGALLGIGFDPERDMSWRVRYPGCKVFDGLPEDVFSDWAAGELLPPERPPPGHPVIVLASGENTNFRLRAGNDKMPSLEKFLAPLRALEGVVDSSFNPDFGVLQMSPSLLEPLAVKGLSTSILRLLERKYIMRLKLVNHLDHGLLQDRRVLVVVASRFSGLVSVPLQPYTSTGPDSVRLAKKVGDIIGELRFKNTRVSEGGSAGFVSSLVPDREDDNGFPSRYIYNHRTGEHMAPAAEMGIPPRIVGMDDDTVLLSWDCHQPPYHRDRGDKLTPREIARLLHFKDDFVLYGSVESQYREMLAAQPPSLSQAIAENILKVAKLSRRIEIPAVRVGATRNKRARVEDDDGPDGVSEERIHS
ncbi:C-5 cytosine methyltransferase [Pleurostoma richardsiae]|uniref:C-5 cytosine methyltransferase n=1 Tax=Pleurostoma richardsiae TaxID=41990 RepID=A0AA38S4U4_9PEZI|nr:C-5 cytosine methyltransferase [Pleurostoma richardsiae]